MSEPDSLPYIAAAQGNLNFVAEELGKDYPVTTDDALYLAAAHALVAVAMELRALRVRLEGEHG